MTLSRRRFILGSAAAAGTLSVLSPRSLGCEERLSGNSPIDFSMGFPPGAIRLNRNENPLGPSERALAGAKAGLDGSNRYADPIVLRERLARLHGVEESMILIGTGSGELLHLAPMAYLLGGGNLVSTLETFRSTPHYALKLGAAVRWVKLRPDWSYDVEGLLEAVDSDTRIFYLVNPNNPTGAALRYDELQAIASALPKRVLFLIDEAYVHFLPEKNRSGLDLLKAGHDNVLVTRTFSKVYGIAGLRVGYGIGHPDVMKKLANFGCGPTSTNTAGFGAAVAALEDEEHASRFVSHAARARAFYEKELGAMGLDSIPGVSPFICVDVGSEAAAIVERLERRGIFVRSGEEWDLPRHLRISFGLEEENRAFVSALRELRA